MLRTFVSSSVSSSVSRIVSSFIFGLFAAFLIVSPVAAQIDTEGNDLNSFGPLTSAEQATLFEAGVQAYDDGDFAAAFHIWLPLAQNDNMSAQRNVAHLLRRGIGVEQDHERALYFYRRAADRGLVSAMVNLGSMLRAGQGVEEPQHREAAQWFYVAARAGDARAQYVLGVMAARGEGMEADRELAIRLFTAAAEQGLREARQRLAEAGIEPENIGDAPERAPTDAPSELRPLPDFAPVTSRQLNVAPTLRTSRAEPVAPMPEVAVAQPVAAQSAAERAAVVAPSGSSQPRVVTGSSTPATVQTRPAPAAVARQQAPQGPQGPPAAQRVVRTEPVAQPRASQNVPLVQSVTMQPATAEIQERVQARPRSTSDLIVMPPAQTYGVETVDLEEELPEEEAAPVNRLLGGTQ